MGTSHCPAKDQQTMNRLTTNYQPISAGQGMFEAWPTLPAVDLESQSEEFIGYHLVEAIMKVCLAYLQSAFKGIGS